MSAANTNGAVALSGDRFRIGEDDFQLADILAPSLYALQSMSPPYVNEAKEHLQQLLTNSPFEFDDIAPPTRWGMRVVRTGESEKTASLEQRLIAAGAARVAPQTDDIAFIERLLTVERIARQGKKGLWSLDAYQVFDADNATGAIGGYHLVEGSVVSARKARSRFYLNFGDDYRTDFTASTTSILYRRWVKAGFDLASLQGARLRIRGFVVDINGPSVDLTHESQIEDMSIV
ncbi:MAG: thermonuclease family protein [Pseudomonadota bacterium]